MAAPQMRETPLAGGVIAKETAATDASIICADLSAGKPYKTLQAQFALRGHELVQFPDGTFACSKWGLTRLLPTIAAVEAFLRQIGGEA